VKDAPVFNRTEVTEAASLENRPRMMLSMRVRVLVDAFIECLRDRASIWSTKEV
jgi:hypothetical protein